MRDLIRVKDEESFYRFLVTCAARTGGLDCGDSPARTTPRPPTLAIITMPRLVSALLVLTRQNLKPLLYQQSSRSRGGGRGGVRRCRACRVAGPRQQRERAGMRKLIGQDQRA